MRVLSTAAGFFLATTLPAYAYLDPGTGSMVLQAILASVAVAGATVSMYWGKVRAVVDAILRKKKRF